MLYCKTWDLDHKVIRKRFTQVINEEESQVTRVEITISSHRYFGLALSYRTWSLEGRGFDSSGLHVEVSLG